MAAALLRLSERDADGHQLSVAASINTSANYEVFTMGRGVVILGGDIPLPGVPIQRIPIMSTVVYRCYGDARYKLCNQEEGDG